MSNDPSPDSPLPAPLPVARPPDDAGSGTSGEAAPLLSGGHSLDDFHWVPVLKKPRKDGWSPARQRAFIEALADTGSVLTAAQIVGMSERSAQKLRRSPGAESFDRAWTAAIHAASKKLLDEAFERALVGSDEPVFDRDGRRVGRRFRRSDSMLQFLLRGYFPERFGWAGQPGQHRAPPGQPALLQRGAEPEGTESGASTSALPAVAEALDRLLPPAPAEPHRLLDREALEDALTVANIMDGDLPHYYRDDQPAPEPRFNPPTQEPPSGQD